MLCIKERTPKPNPFNLFLALLGVLSSCLTVDIVVPLLETGTALFMSAAWLLPLTCRVFFVVPASQPLAKILI